MVSIHFFKTLFGKNKEMFTHNGVDFKRNRKSFMPAVVTSESKNASLDAETLVIYDIPPRFHYY